MPMTDRNVDQARLRFSIVIPTYQRRDLVAANVAALARQEFADGFEVIVVVDGSTDGSAAALRALDTSFPLVVLEQPNQGRSAACNRGVSAARGEILLFLDDDMEAHPRLLAEHERSLQEGADMVIGHVPLHPNSPKNALSAGVGSWAENRARQLSAPGSVPTLPDLLTGQASISRSLFRQLGEFDTNFTRGGSFGNEDLDLGYRLLSQGHRVVFNPNAVSWQYYVVQPRQYLRQWHQAGQADVDFVRKYPDQRVAIFTPRKLRQRRHWMIAPVAAVLRWVLVRRVEQGYMDARTTRWFHRVRWYEYWRGVAEAGGMPRPRPLRVLAYHAISDTSGTGRFEPYGVRPEDFRQQVGVLKRAGYHFVSVDEVVRFVCGAGGLPRRPVLMTFDDCYESVLEYAVPVLVDQGVPAAAFAVADRLGGTNDWDQWPGATRLPLLNADGLRRLASAGVEIGAHSRTHRQLPRMSVHDLADEVGGSCENLKTKGFSPVRLFAYPYGEFNERVQQAVASAGCELAFTVDPGFVHLGVDPYRIPRIEILRRDVGWKFRWKVAVAGPLVRPKENRLNLVRSVWLRWVEPIKLGISRRLLRNSLRF